MQDNDKLYGAEPQCCLHDTALTSCSGFTISLPEYERTIPTLWSTVKSMHASMRSRLVRSHVRPAFMKENPDLVVKDNALEFISDDGGESYNRCHCPFPRVLPPAPS
jgi:hypothetical protein